MPGYIYIGDTPIDDGAPYLFGWDTWDEGEAARREPTVQPTAGGSFAIYPLETAYLPRTGKIAVYAASTDELDKRRIGSDLRAMLNGPRVLHIGGRWLTAYFSKAREVSDDSRKAATIVGVEAAFTAVDPLWSLAQPLAGIDGAVVNPGPAWDLFDDNVLPDPLPVYTFDSNSFDFENWGNAYTWAAGTVAGGPVSTTIYLSGLGTSRLAIAIDASGDGTFTAEGGFYLAPGTNPIEVQDVAGAPQTVGGGFELSFGGTYMRFH